VHDVSLPLSPRTPVYPGDPPVRIERRLALERGDAANLSFLSLGTHAGTHVDPPLHFLAGGAGVDALPFEALVGPARVVPAPEGVTALGAEHVQAWNPGAARGPGGRRILMKSANSARWHGAGDPRGDFVHLTPGGARVLVEAGVLLFGTDGLSIEPVHHDRFPCHLALLGAGVVIVEGLDLSAVDPGEYGLVCLPLRIENGDGAPARVLLLEGASLPG
jgi:arylformamidase